MSFSEIEFQNLFLTFKKDKKQFLNDFYLFSEEKQKDFLKTKILNNGVSLEEKVKIFLFFVENNLIKENFLIEKMAFETRNSKKYSNILFLKLKEINTDVAIDFLSQVFDMGKYLSNKDLEYLGINDFIINNLKLIIKKEKDLFSKYDFINNLYFRSKEEKDKELYLRIEQELLNASDNFKFRIGKINYFNNADFFLSIKNYSFLSEDTIKEKREYFKKILESKPKNTTIEKQIIFYSDIALIDKNNFDYNFIKNLLIDYKPEEKINNLEHSYTLSYSYFNQVIRTAILNKTKDEVLEEIVFENIKETIKKLSIEFGIHVNFHEKQLSIFKLTNPEKFKDFFENNKINNIEYFQNIISTNKNVNEKINLLIKNFDLSFLIDNYKKLLEIDPMIYFLTINNKCLYQLHDIYIKKVSYLMEERQYELIEKIKKYVLENNISEEEFKKILLNLDFSFKSEKSYNASLNFLFIIEKIYPNLSEKILDKFENSFWKEDKETLEKRKEKFEKFKTTSQAKYILDYEDNPKEISRLKRKLNLEIKKELKEIEKNFIEQQNKLIKSLKPKTLFKI